MVAGVCFLLLVSLVLESVLKSFSDYVQTMFPGGILIALDPRGTGGLITSNDNWGSNAARKCHCAGTIL